MVLLEWCLYVPSDTFGLFGASLGFVSFNVHDLTTPLLKELPIGSYGFILANVTSTRESGRRDTHQLE